MTERPSESAVIDDLIYGEGTESTERVAFSFGNSVAGVDCFRQLVEAIVDSVIIHRDGRILYANPSAERNFGVSKPGALVGCALFDFVAEQDHEKLTALVQRVAKTGSSSAIVAYTKLGEDGERRDIETIATRISIAGEMAILNVCRDVTERNRTKLALKNSEARFETLARLSPEAIIAVCAGDIVFANAAAASLLGMAHEREIEGREANSFCADEQDCLMSLGLGADGRRDQVPCQACVRFLRQDGSAIDLEVTSIPYMYGEQPAAYLILRDVTERLRDEERHRYLASHDPLTDLPNRLEFQRCLSARLADQAGKPHGRFAIHYLDLDYFKTVNDTLGHEVGDHLLKLVAARLRKTVRSTDLVARLGGDEFAVLQSDANVDDAPPLAEKLQQAVSEPYTVGDQLLHTSTTIGIAVFPDHGDEPERLLRRADLALYHAKECGRNAISFFSRDLDVRVQERDSLINQLIRAEAEGEFEVYFQPIASLSSGRIEAVEALLRWNHPERGLMTAEQFIDAVEASREGQRIGAWVLREACARANAWAQAGIDDLCVAVNLSMPFLQRPDFTNVVLGVLEETGLDPGKLELELTERIVISAGAAGIAPKLAELRRHGVHIALDDFGTGYSSLALLRDCVDRIKIDRSFVAGFGTSPDDTAIVRAVTNLGLSLNKRVTAEGVESPETVNMLRSEGCHDIQGYHLAKPMPAAGLIDFLHRSGYRLDPDRSGSPEREQEVEVAN